MEENKTTEQELKRTETERKPKRLWLKITALALCCAIVGGLIGGGLVCVTGNHLAEKEWDELSDFLPRYYGGSVWRRGPFVISPGMVKEFIEDEFLEKPYIGVSVSDSSDPSGALVDSVEKGGPADKAGIMAGDVITMVNNNRINDRLRLAAVVSDLEVGSDIVLTIYRAEEALEYTLSVGGHSVFQ